MGAREPRRWRTEEARRFGGALLCLFLLGGALLPRPGLLVHDHGDALRGHVHVAPDGPGGPPQHSPVGEHHGWTPADPHYAQAADRQDSQHRLASHHHHRLASHHHDRRASHHHDESVHAAPTRTASQSTETVRDAIRPQRASAKGVSDDEIGATPHGAHAHAYDRYQRTLQPEVLRSEIWQTTTQVALVAPADPRPARSSFCRARGPPPSEVRI